MKVLGIVGSPRSKGNTYELVKYSADKIVEIGGFNTEVIELSGKKIEFCKACETCRHTNCCAIEDDLWELFEKMHSADGILIGSPVYTGTSPGLLKALLERTSWLSHTIGRKFSRKVGVPIVVGGRSGQNFTHAELLMWFHINGFYMVGSDYWNIAFGLDKGGVLQDKMVFKVLDTMVDNLVYLLNRLKMAV